MNIESTGANLGPTVAFQGEVGAFSFVAATKFLGDKIQCRACQTFTEVFQSLAADHATYAVIPVENTLYGSVYENYDHLLKWDFPIVGETAVRIEHHLVAMPGLSINQIRRAYSHPVALAQCQKFFAEHPSITATSFYDTAGSIKMVTESGLSDAAGIGSLAAAEIYGGQVLQSNIEDHPQNFTRFVLLSKQPGPDSMVEAEWKTSLVLSTPNVAGALFKVLACFALRDLNLTKIESRPLQARPWEYMFYVDVIGRVEEVAMQNAIANLRELSSFVKVLGSYRTRL